jgi:hypothetical protein
VADTSGIEALARAAADHLAHGTPQTILSGPAPCDECRFRARSAAEQLACDRYVMFYYGKPQSRWEQAPLHPTRAAFEVLFNPDRGPRRGRGLATLRRRGQSIEPTKST